MKGHIVAAFFALTTVTVVTSPVFAEIVTLTSEEVAAVSQLANEQMNDWKSKADFGDLDAMNKLGNMLGGREGLAWLQEAAEQGHAQAQANLAFKYGQGLGVPKNIKLAYVWYAVAAANGHEPAINSRDTFEVMLTNEQRAEAQDLASEFFDRSHTPRSNAARDAPSSFSPISNR